MRRALLVLVAVAGVLVALAPGAAQAHPLGNFSVNHLDRVRISSDRVEVRYVLDQAEIPTFQERGLAPQEVLARKRAEVRRGLTLVVDGRRVALRFAAPGTIGFPQGQGGLRTTRVELALVAMVRDAKAVVLHDRTFPGRVGWKAIVAAAGADTAVRSSAPSGDPTRGLRVYPQELLKSPLDVREASFEVRSGHGTLVAPRGAGEGLVTTTDRSGGDGFAGVFADAAAGHGVLILLLLAAFAWGAFHALSPGHGKAMVAAYLVGARGTPRHALALGATVTITHTIGVFALGLVTLALSQYVLPEDLYPWLNLVSGLLVVGVGAAVLRRRVGEQRTENRGQRQHHHHGHDHHHGHEHPHDHHHHDHDLSWKGLLAMGASAGLIPCPSALVVLLGAIAQHQIALGLLLIVAFSLGLAGTLMAVGLLVVLARERIVARVDVSGRAVAALPAVSALVILGVGVLLTAQAVPQLGG